MNSIFVTGAASGIGKATALLFGQRGWFVGCSDVDEAGAKSVAKQIEHSWWGRIDVTNEDSWRAAVGAFDNAAKTRMDVLFNCAGILRMGKFEDISPEQCRKQLEVNVMGVVLGIQVSLPLLERTAQREGKASIVNMSSASAIYGAPELAVYSASKFAVRALTEALDVELHTKKIRICDVMPGYVDTPMVHSQETKAKTVDRLGIKLTAEDVAATVWKAAHGKGLHYLPQTDLKVLSRLNGLLPEVGRVVMKRLAKV